MTSRIRETSWIVAAVLLGALVWVIYLPLDLQMHQHSMLIDLISTGLLIFAVGVGWFIQRRISAQKGTLDYVLQCEVGNVEFRRRRQKVRQILGSKEDMEKVVHPQDAADWENRFLVGAFLSHFEFIAASIKNKTMDEKTYRDWNGSAYVSAWNKSKEYISRRRCAGRKPNRYVLFEKYAERWDK